MITNYKPKMDLLAEHKQNLVREQIRSVKAGLKMKYKLLKQTQEAIYNSLLQLDELEHWEKSLKVSPKGKTEIL